MVEEVVQAHQDLEGRKILGPAVIVPELTSTSISDICKLKSIC